MRMFVGFLPVPHRPLNFRGRFRNPTISKTGLIFTMVTSCQHLTIATNTSILNIITYSRFLDYVFFIEKKTTFSDARFLHNLSQGNLSELAFSDVIIKDKLFYLIILKIFWHVLYFDGSLRQNRVHKIHYIYYGAIETIVDESPLFLHAKIPAHLLDRPLFILVHGTSFGVSTMH